MNNLVIKNIYLATGDLYENIEFDGTKDAFIELINKDGFIRVKDGKLEVLINPNFIASIMF